MKTNDNLLAAFREFELNSNQQTTIKAGIGQDPPGTNCTEEEAQTESGGTTTTDTYWSCGDEHEIALR